MVGVDVFVWVTVGVGVSELVGVFVGVDVFVWVTVGVGVGVTDNGVPVFVGVTLCVGVFVEVTVLVGVTVGVDVLVGVTLGVTDGVAVLLGVGVGVVDEELGVWVIGGHSIVESIVKFENAVL